MTIGINSQFFNLDEYFHWLFYTQNNNIQRIEIIIICVIMYHFETALVLMWIGALVTYLSSQSQQLTSSFIPKVFAWPLLIAFTVLSTYLLSYQYGIATSVLLNISALLLSWIALILIAGHWRLKVFPVTSLGIVIAIIFSQFGGV